MQAIEQNREARPIEGQVVQWTDKEVAMLRAMWPTNTARTIAKALGPNVTRNMVIGKAARLKLERKQAPARAKAEAEAKAA